ncbi:sigma-70 family RNA polymerase sigma factor [Pedobacter psychrodurus]|uniref:sigma-70 family RNA polymerase sigma factor n=1 Tax=Pedobacter psychrodurus TaxID=2530456 RepID=UPI002930441E|nr:sigma-70 family RNA polymerase sigma factor [Pedobacter psychrodurus]
MKNIKEQMINAELIDPHSWVVRYADYLFTYAVSRLNDEEVAKDLVQETFLAALERLDKFEGNCSEKTWLTAILKYKVIDVYRKKARGLDQEMKKVKNGEEEDEFFYPEEGNWRVEHWPQEMGIEEPDALISKEFMEILQNCMKKLPQLWLAIFTMKHMDEEETSEICSALSVTSANFWVIIHRTKVNLRACLQKNWM